MATTPGLESQDTKLRGVGGEGAGISVGGITSGGDRAVALSAESQLSSREASKSSNDGAPLIPLDPERKRISPKTKRLVLAKLGAATKADGGLTLANVATEDPLFLSPVAQVDKPTPNPSEQLDSRTSPPAQTPPSDLEKKQRRAERFGLDLQISESEKRTIRAARSSLLQASALACNSVCGSGSGLAEVWGEPVAAVVCGGLHNFSQLMFCLARQVWSNNRQHRP